MKRLVALFLCVASLAQAQAYYEKSSIPPSIKASADTTGATDTAALSAALARGPVYLAKGTYYVCNVIVPNGVYLVGVGSLGYADNYTTTTAQTKLVASTGCATQVLNVSAVANGGVLEKLYIDCNGLDIMGIGNASHRLNIDSLTVTNCSPAGVKGGLGSTSGYSFGTKIHHSNFYGNGYGVIDLIDGAVDDTNFTSSNNCGAYFTTGSGYTNFTATRFEWNTTYGLCNFQGVGVQITGGLFDRNTLGGLKLNGSDKTTVTGTIFVRNGKDNGTTLLEATQIAITGAATDSTFTGIQTVVGNETIWGSVGGTGTVTPKYVFSFDTGINTPDGVYISNSLLTGYTSAFVNAAGSTPTNYSVINSRGKADLLNAPLPVAQGGTGSASGVTLAALATQATNTVVGNATSGTAAPTALAVGTCSTTASALSWTTNTGFGCNTAVNAATLGGATFAAPAALGSGTPAPVTGTTVTATTNYVHGITILCQSGTAVNNSALTNTAEDNLAVCTIPAGAPGTNGMLRITTAWLGTTTATVKTGIIRHGTAACTPGATCSTGSLVMTGGQTSNNPYMQTLTMVRNANSASAQTVYNINGQAPFAAGFTTQYSNAINTGNVSYLNFDCTDGTTSSGAEFCGLLGYTVELIVP